MSYSGADILPYHLINLIIIQYLVLTVTHTHTKSLGVQQKITENQSLQKFTWV